MTKNSAGKVLAALLVFRVVLQIAIWRFGYVALTADDFGRVVAAAIWALDPHLMNSGAWLPAPTYLWGLLLGVWWNLDWAPRLLSVLLGLLSIVLTYGLTGRLFQNRTTALVASALLALNPAHVWLSSTALTEIPYFVCILGVTLGVLYFLETSNYRALLAASLLLLAANGSRFEGWMFSIVYSLFLTTYWLYQAYKAGGMRLRLLPILALAALPWAFPIYWTVSDYLVYHTWLSFMDVVTSWKSTYYGTQHSFRYYWDTFIRLDRLGIVFLLAALPALIVATLAQKPRRWTWIWYETALIGPFLIYCILHRGQIEPPGNFIRYLAPFMFMMYPALAAVAVKWMGKIQAKAVRTGLAAGFLIVFLFIQLQGVFVFNNEPSVGGYWVGKQIQELRRAHPELSDRPVLVELGYWDYVGVHVGANDLMQIHYDRILDIYKRPGTLIDPQQPEQIRSCLLEGGYSYMVVKDKALRDSAESLGLQAEAEVSGYGFYSLVPAFLDQPVDKLQPCKAPFITPLTLN